MKCVWCFVQLCAGNLWASDGVSFALDVWWFKCKMISNHFSRLYWRRLKIVLSRSLQDGTQKDCSELVLLMSSFLWWQQSLWRSLRACPMHIIETNWLETIAMDCFRSIWSIRLELNVENCWVWIIMTIYLIRGKTLRLQNLFLTSKVCAHGVLIEMDRITTIFLCYSWWGLSQELQRYILGAYFCTCCIKCNRWSELWRVCGVLLWWMKYHQSSFQVDFAKKVWWQEICSSDGSSNPGMNCLDQVIREESPMTSHSHCFLITQMNFKSQAKKLQPSIVLWRKTDIFLLKQREDLTRLMRFRDVLIQK